MTIVPLRYRQDPDPISANILLAAVDNDGLVVVGLDAARPLVEVGFLQVVPCDWVEAPLAALEMTERGWQAYLAGRLARGTRRRQRISGGARRPAGVTSAGVPAA
jgi:hypothetical protein